MEGDVVYQLLMKNTIAISIHSLRMEGDRQWIFQFDFDILFQSTPSAWRETLTNWRIMDAGDISIHSLRMEGDAAHRTGNREIRISIHSLRMEGDRSGVSGNSGETEFQSTPSAWRETCEKSSRQGLGVVISIHSLRMEGDPSTTKPSVVILIFQSTPSAWRETKLVSATVPYLTISIHSLRMEGDL